MSTVNRQPTYSSDYLHRSLKFGRLSLKYFYGIHLDSIAQHISNHFSPLLAFAWFAASCRDGHEYVYNMYVCFDSSIAFYYDKYAIYFCSNACLTRRASVSAGPLKFTLTKKQKTVPNLSSSTLL